MAKATKHAPTAKPPPKRKAKKSNQKRVRPKPDRERLSGGEMETLARPVTAVSAERGVLVASHRPARSSITAPATSWQALAYIYFEGRAGARPPICSPRMKRGGSRRISPKSQSTGAAPNRHRWR
jgi:hypothetical protein